MVHQLFLLPFDILYVLFLIRLLRDPIIPESRRSPYWWVGVLVVFETASAVLIAVEDSHFRGFGYHANGNTIFVAVAIGVLGWATFAWLRNARGLLAAILMSYAAGDLVAIRAFPLNYLRSDMLPVIGWADQRLLSHLNPYGTMHVGTRLYDFPYLPGMLVAYVPAAALHVDLRYASLGYLLLLVALIWNNTRAGCRMAVAASLGLFLLCPFLQYRHEIYLQPHWFLLTLAVFLMQRRKFFCAAMVWGVSCGVYQFSWILVPFVVLNAYRRRGVPEVLKVVLGIGAGALMVIGPFLSSARERIASNTVGQWSRLPHALADPINVSYWLTYLIRPDQLKWVQAVILVAIFGYCLIRGRCATLADTLRWMCCALGVFIPLNVLVDGYFYLTLLLLLLLYVCVANGWWREPGEFPGGESLCSGFRTPGAGVRSGAGQ